MTYNSLKHENEKEIIPYLTFLSTGIFLFREQ